MGMVRAAALALEFGFIVGGFVVVGLLGGRWLDEQLQTEPLFVLLGLLLALGSSFYVFYLIVRFLHGGKV